ncbi:unnamed protein product [Mytilus edulis]|uniref:Uncharacterized protein n=1 Tax=Mytilus edulis TaxID=6550 RepID=A0A8S3TJH2_MYTED|nr:unnamed protein product [Mytilus edulis]
MPSKVPKRSNRKRKITQRLGEVIQNIGSSDLGKGVPIGNPVPSSSNPNNNSGQLSADNPHVQSNPIDPNTDVISPDPILIPTHQGVNSICPPRQDTSRCNTTEMTTPSQSHSTNIIDNQSFESSHPSCSNVISRSGQQCVMPTEGSPSQQVVNHLLQGTPNIDTFSNEQLQLSLQWAGCDTAVYKGHSFRIGAASSAAMMGISSDKIQLMGR